MDTDLTVIIPLYNQEKYIKKCVESIENQKNINLSIIIINDGSTDNSLKICEELAKRNDRIKIISQENKGLAGARYTGIVAAKSNFVTFVDADDFICANAYDDAISYIKNGYDQIFYEISRYYNDKNIKREYHIIEEGKYDRERIEKEIYPKMIWDFARKTPGIECSQCVRIVKKDLLLNIYNNLNGKKFYYGEDIVITFPLMQFVNKLAVISKSFYMHRQRDNNTAPPYIKSEGYFDEIARMYSYLREAMKGNGNYDFTKQIDYMYIYSVGLKKWSYNDYEFPREFLFPFDKVPTGKRIILYGAGLVGKTYYMQLKKLSYCSEIAWIDRNADNIIDEQGVMLPDELEKDRYYSFDYIVVAMENKKVAEEIKKFCLSIGYSNEKIII